MSKTLGLVLSINLMAAMLLTACAPAAAPVQPTTALHLTPLYSTPLYSTPPATAASKAGAAAALPDGFKVGLVTDTGGVNDRVTLVPTFNQLAWAGVQKAAKDMGFEAKNAESKQPADYEKNIDELATEGYNVIITIGSPMGDATALKAKQYPDIKFAIVDNCLRH